MTHAGDVIATPWPVRLSVNMHPLEMHKHVVCGTRVAINRQRITPMPLLTPLRSTKAKENYAMATAAYPSNSPNPLVVSALYSWMTCSLPTREKKILPLLSCFN